MRGAPSLQNIPVIMEDAANIRAWDPIGIENYKKLFWGEHIWSCGHYLSHTANICVNVLDGVNDIDLPADAGF